MAYQYWPIGLLLCRNPCFSGYGSAISLLSNFQSKIVLVAILVFLDMVLQYARVAAIEEPAKEGRNPCFSGYGSAIFKPFPRNLQDKRRSQSLFFWIWFCNRVVKVLIVVGKSVAILVFLDMVLQ